MFVTASQKKIPIRICLGCGEKLPKKDMLRIVRNKEGEIHVDPSGRMNGRGCYVCGKKECMDSIIRQKKLSRSFETNVEPFAYETVKSEFEQWLNNGGQNIGN